MSYAGIDYGMGTTNVDRRNGIRYGVISLHALNDYAIESFEADYGEPTCPACGNLAVEYDDDAHEEYAQTSYGCDDYACESCETTLDSGEVYGEEPNSWTLSDGNYRASMSGRANSNIFVTRSPYFTRAQYCSPYAPGAGYLERYCPDGPRTYALGHSWFSGNVAPYPVYSVETGARVHPEYDVLCGLDMTV